MKQSYYFPWDLQIYVSFKSKSFGITLASFESQFNHSVAVILDKLTF